MKCPGSIREEETIPSTTSSYAVDGTHSHALLDSCLRFGVSPEDMVGKTISSHEGAFQVDEDRASRVRLAYEYVKEVSTPSTILKLESKVNPERLVGRSDMYGTVDVQLIDNETLEIIDYKDGIGRVDPFENPQMIIYALGVLSEMEGYEPNYVKMTIIQPKLATFGENVVNSIIISLNKLKSYIPVLKDCADATDTADAPLIAGEKQCHFCPVKGNCSSLISKSLGDIGIKFDNLETVQEISNKDTNSISEDELRELLEAIPLLKQLIVSTEEEALKRLKLGKEIPGFKLVRGNGSRRWSLPEEEIAEKLTKMGIPKSEVLVTKVVSPAQAEKLRWTKKDGTVKRLTPRQLTTLAQEYIIKTEGSLTIANELDPRKSVKLEPNENELNQLFEPVNEE